MFSYSPCWSHIGSPNTRDDDQLVTSVSIHDAAFSDHFVVNCALSMEKPLFTKKQIIYCSFKNFDIDLFISDTRSSSLISDPPNELDDLVALYDSELSGIFNRHVPIKKRTVTIRPAAPWYSEELKSHPSTRIFLLFSHDVFTRQVGLP